MGDLRDKERNLHVRAALMEAVGLELAQVLFYVSHERVVDANSIMKMKKYTEALDSILSEGANNEKV